jgi:hypothetical protein
LRVKWVGGPRPELHIFMNDGAISKILWRDTKDAASLMSANLGQCFIDEATEVSEHFYNMIWASLGRCVCADGKHAPRKLAWAANPGPGWCKRLFPVGPEPKKRGYRSNNYVLWRGYVPAKPSDNPNNPADYEEGLRAVYPEDWVRRYVDGDWDAFSGQVFTEFEDKVHIWPERGLDHSRQPWTHLVTLDWGFRNPTACLMVSIDYCGRFWVWREHRASELRPEQHAPHILDLVRGVKPSLWLIDYAASDQSTGVSIREQMNNLGLPFNKCSKNKNGPDGSVMFLKMLMSSGRFIVAPECAGLIRELKDAKWEEAEEGKEARERLEDGDDHSLDALFMAVEWYRAQPISRAASEIDDIRAYLRGERQFARANRIDRERIVLERDGTPAERRRAASRYWEKGLM